MGWRQKGGYVYILASGRNGTLYAGVTSDLSKRIWQHRSKFVDGFAEKYRALALVYYECHNDIAAAIAREKQIKKWRREWKLNLIKKQNPEWEDLYPKIL